VVTAIASRPTGHVATMNGALLYGVLSSSRAAVAHSRDVSTLFLTHGPFVYRRALRLLGTKEDADEVTQEIFIRVLSGARPPDEGVVAWLSRITTNFCLNRLRNQTRQQELLLERVAPVTDEVESEKAHLMAEVRALISRADAKQAEAAFYVYVDGLSQDEAAELLGVSQRTVSNLLTRFAVWAREQSGEPGGGKP